MIQLPGTLGQAPEAQTVDALDLLRQTAELLQTIKRHADEAAEALQRVVDLRNGIR